MTDIDRIAYSIGHSAQKTAMVFSRIEWNSLIQESGEPTLLSDAPEPLQAVERNAMVVAIAASGHINPDPGIDIVRHDEQDAPYVYNLDHYRVLENLHKHPSCEEVLRTAGIESSETLSAALADNVFIVGPYNKEHPDHWREHLPDCILKSQSKSS